jgi:hypothetical protein
VSGTPRPTIKPQPVNTIQEMLEIKRIDPETLKTERLKEDPRITALRDKDGYLNLVPKSSLDAVVAERDALKADYNGLKEMSTFLDNQYYKQRSELAVTQAKLKKAMECVDFYADVHNWESPYVVKDPDHKAAKIKKELDSITAESIKGGT